MKKILRIATRGSKLARAQSEAVGKEIQAAWPDSGLEVEYHIVSTRGDEILDRAAGAIGKGAFVREVQAALLQGHADLAIHSFKDLPTDGVPGLKIAAVPQRADARDALISRTGKALQFLPEGSRVGTGSKRRAGQLLRRRSDLQPVPIRGNIDTRLAKLDAGEDYDALILAAAGLERLGLRERVTQYFDRDQMIPAAGQGALALEVRENDAETQALLAPIHDELSAFTVMAERRCLEMLGGGCSVPVGIHAISDGERMVIYGIVHSEDGARTARMQWAGPQREAKDLGETLAELLISIGADKILRGEDIPRTMRYATRIPEGFGKLKTEGRE